MHLQSFRAVFFIFLFFLQVALVTESHAAGERKNTDPWQHLNRPVFQINRTLDAWLLRPLAVGYDRYLPAPAKAGLRNFFNNADDVKVVVNDLLQLKLDQAGQDAGRFLLNTTVGIGGIFDPASELGLDKHYEDFGQTLAVWGVNDGGYLMLPLLGASTVRDTFGKIPDYLLNPLRWVSPDRSRNQFLASGIVVRRASYLPLEDSIRGDEYLYVRNAYLQRREYLIADGMVYDEFDDF